ncbi:amino acid permease [Streptomyces sp. NPDC048665]|uniref:APC family permease n=1 Tax=Streptomyces sp. NPDC048665 TaxID=3155490 RepID=UPI00342A351B
MVERRPGLGVGTGTALCIGAVLGPGVLTLTSTAAAAAGPGSILAWLGLVVVSLPIAWVFAVLGARHPDGGGVATFARRAFGPRLAAPVGWWFYWAVPLGVPAAALIGGEYTAAAAGWGHSTAAVVALLVLATAYGSNLVGLRLSGRIQLLMVGLLASLLAVTITVAGTHVQRAHFTPFMPRDWTSVGIAAGILFFAFAGWEAISHLSAEFSAPRRDLPRATLLAWGIVSVLYLGLALVTIGVLGPRAGTTTTPLTLLLEQGFGAPARAVAATAALLLTFGAVNAYLAGAARLGEALGHQDAMPRSITTKAAGATAVPRRSLTVVTLASAVIAVTAAFGLIGLDSLLRATSACLAAVTLAGLASATVLLRGRALLRISAVVSCGMVGTVLIFCGPFLLVPTALAAAATGFHTVSTSARTVRSARAHETARSREAAGNREKGIAA